MGKNTMVRLKLDENNSKPYDRCANFSNFRYEEPSKASSTISQSTSACFPTSRVLHTVILHPRRSVLTTSGNVGFIFTNADLNKTRDVILAEKVSAPARAGAIAPLDVYVPAGNTGMEPGKTAFFQALSVPTKIARGTIEITTDLKLVEAGTKVGASEATLLNMLNISPFTYGMSIAQVYDGGQTFAPSVLDIKEEQLFKALNSAIATITQISLAANYPTLPSIMHSFMNSYKNVLAVAIETDYSWEGISNLKDRIANPDAYVNAAPTETEVEPDTTTDPVEEKPEEPEEESGDDGMMSKLKIEFHILTSLQALGVSLTRSCRNACVAAEQQSRHDNALSRFNFLLESSYLHPRSFHPSATQYRGPHSSAQRTAHPFLSYFTLWRTINYFLTLISMTRQQNNNTLIF